MTKQKLLNFICIATLTLIALLALSGWGWLAWYGWQVMTP